MAFALQPGLIAVAVFVGVYLLIMLGLRELTVASLAGVAILLLTNVLSWTEALSYMDFNVLGMLIGVMIIIHMLSRVGFFRWIGIHMANLVKCDPMKMMFVFICITFLLSSFTIANVVTVLLMAVVVIEISEILELDPRPFIMALIFASNIGGMSTSISSLPNILVASASGMTFVDFTAHMWPMAVANLAMVLFMFSFLRKEELAKMRPKYTRIPVSPSEVITDKKLFAFLLATFFVMVAMLVVSPMIGVSPGAMALIVAAIALVVVGERAGPVIREVDWETVISVACLLVLVGGLEKTGVIHDLSGAIIATADGNRVASLMLIFWSSTLVSCFVDNVPFTIALISVLKDMAKAGVNVSPLWWALLAGAGIGGNGTIVASYANIVVVGETTRRGYRIEPKAFAKVGLSFVLMASAITSGILLAIYGL